MRLLLRLFGIISALCFGTVVWQFLMPDPRVSSSQNSLRAKGVTSLAEAGALGSQRQVRVVYPDATTGTSVMVSSKVDVAPEAVEALAVPTHVPADLPAAEQSAPRAISTGATINLNTASVESLNQIAGGGSIGRTIVAHRPYQSVDDLLTKRVLRRSVFDRIRQQVAAE